MLEHRRLAIGAPQPLKLLDDVAHGRAVLHELDGDRHDILCLVLRGFDQRVEQPLHFCLVARRTHVTRAGNLALRGRRIVRVSLDLVLFFVHDELIDADHRLFAVLLAKGGLVGEVRDLLLEPAFLDELDGAAISLDVIEGIENAFLVFAGE